ncbi:MAG: hypothetical protein NVSMB64_12100 [Candidatus Velthaea sp.]
MDVIEELRRLPSPAPFPHALGFDGEALWMGSRETRRMYAIDPKTWSARDEGEAPGTPWGLTVVGDELRVLCGEGPDDTRVIRKFIPGKGFSKSEKIDAPEDTGSQLGFDGDSLYVVQWYRKRILALDDRGTVGTIVHAPHELCGLTITSGRFYCIATDNEGTGPYWLTCIDARGGGVKSTDLAIIPFPARSLAFDGERFWTNHREAHEIVAFAPPAGTF